MAIRRDEAPEPGRAGAAHRVGTLLIAVLQGLLDLFGCPCMLLSQTIQQLSQQGPVAREPIERDPFESSPLALDHSEISSELRDAVDALIEEPVAPRDERGEHLTPEERKRLRALGYAR